MTDKAKRIVEVLRYCSSGNNGSHCKGCPYYFRDTKQKPCINVLWEESANLIESLSDKNKQLEYTLVGVMHFVDKWLDGVEPYSLVDDPSGQIAVDRAAEARRITLEHIEDLTREMYRRGQELCGIKEGEN